MDTKDSELLELAAKAAGYLVTPSPLGNLMIAEPGRGQRLWNPLLLDGDALRLAARLRLQIIPGKHQGDGCSVNPTRHGTPGVTAFVESKDMLEQMKKAIVLCAAEIGRSEQ